MAVLPILLYPNKTLKEKSITVESITPEIEQDIANIKIKDTQYFVSEASGETISKEAVNNMNY